MFGLTKREQRWKAEQEACSLLANVAVEIVTQAAKVRVAEIHAKMDELREENALLKERVRRLQAELGKEE